MSQLSSPSKPTETLTPLIPTETADVLPSPSSTPFENPFSKTPVPSSQTSYDNLGVSIALEVSPMLPLSLVPASAATMENQCEGLDLGFLLMKCLTGSSLRNQTVKMSNPCPRRFEELLQNIRPKGPSRLRQVEDLNPRDQGQSLVSDLISSQEKSNAKITKLTGLLAQKEAEIVCLKATPIREPGLVAALR
ncbi:hypothetical protein HAX54_030624 [Datura stramonium]|uniref:Uncharacterized protein n=1 Tax=Datura stramonium TaxID=4076 RepID=A0ABS8SB72_DATST|nr:hypothetical protein [Datura stramonium]